MEHNTKQKHSRRFIGVVVSDTMDKTRVVAVTQQKRNERYGKFYKKTTRCAAHDQNNEYHVGDQVVIQETRPYSRTKRWIIVEKTGSVVIAATSEIADELKEIDPHKAALDTQKETE
ncbi:MAG: 30S ribosomal protein S17 [Candidatus Pacebacteria bacterium]|nr:30S ribosomal protein S17 [Candidatus Paceibacterota bacterium]